MKELLKRMVEDYNNYSKLVALNYAQVKEGKCDETTLQWNRGNLNRIEEYMEELAKALGVTIKFECGEHRFGYDNWMRTLTYVTAKIA